MCGRVSDFSLYILPTTGSSTFKWVNLVKILQFNIRRFTFATWQTPTVCVSIKYSPCHYTTAFSRITIILANIYCASVCWEEQKRRLDWSKCWHLSCVFVAAMVLSGLVMWRHQLCSISLCRPSPNHDGNCQGQISHTCWIMGTTIDWAQLAVGEFICVYVCDWA